MSATAVDLQRPDLRAHPASATDPLAPLRRAASRVERVHGPHPARPAPLAHRSALPEGVRLRGSELVDGSRTGELLADSARLWGGSEHASAALAWKTYCYWAIVPVVLGYVAARRVPVLEAEDFQFTIAAEGEPMFSGRGLRPRFLVLGDDPLADSAGFETAPGEAAMLERTRESLFDRHLDGVLEAVRGRVRVGRRTLLGSLASGIAYAVATCACAGRDAAEATAKTLLEAFDVADLVDVSTDEDGRLVYRRHTCCLAFTIDGCGTCATCCVQSGRR
ncbi:hypothetical protein GCM10029992_08100 [Glycomyces albus]